jgi:hypothetical protein
MFGCTSLDMPAPSKNAGGPQAWGHQGVRIAAASGKNMESPSSPWHIRITRPVSDVPQTARLYCEGLGLFGLDSFQNQLTGALERLLAHLYEITGVVATHTYIVLSTYL